MVTGRVFGVWFVAGGIPGFDMRLGRVWCCRFRRADVKIVFRQRVPTLNKRRLTNYKYRYEHGNRHNIQRVMYSFRIKLPNGRWVIRYVSPSLAAVHESILPTRHNTTSILTGNLHLVHSQETYILSTAYIYVSGSLLVMRSLLISQRKSTSEHGAHPCAGYIKPIELPGWHLEASMRRLLIKRSG